MALAGPPQSHDNRAAAKPIFTQVLRKRGLLGSSRRASNGGIMLYGGKGQSQLCPGGSRKEKRTMYKRSTSMRGARPPFGAQVAFARGATGLGWTGLGALAVGASAAD